ncbi:hypothetical protein PAXRUDRAFT_831027, partial [Paxillus rubicundulus Ve08.2h10]
MWVRCVESGPTESKFDPTDISVPPEMATTHTRTRNGLSQPACEFSAAPGHFRMPTLAILTSTARFRRFCFQRTCMFSTHPYIFTLARVFSLIHAFL